MSNNTNSKSEPNDTKDCDADEPILYRRVRTPSIVVQSLGISSKGESNIIESIEFPNDDETSDHSNSSEGTDPKSSNSGCVDEGQSIASKDAAGQASDNSAKGSLSSIHQSTGSPGVNSPVRTMRPAAKSTAGVYGANNRRLSLTIGSTAPRRLSLTVEGLSSSFVNPSAASSNTSGNATGSLRNKVALKPGHSLMGWINLAANAKDLSGTNGKIIEVTPEELEKHNTEEDCWIGLKGNVYNITKYLQYHPGGVEEIMRGAGRDATELFDEVHGWVNYESILAKCLIGPYKVECPLTPVGREK